MNKETKYEKAIIAIAEKVNSFGGTIITFNDCFTMGFRPNGKKGCVLYSINCNGSIGVKDLKTTEIFYIPIHWLSEYILFNIYITYKEKCKEQLTEWAYKEILAVDEKAFQEK